MKDNSTCTNKKESLEAEKAGLEQVCRTSYSYSSGNLQGFLPGVYILPPDQQLSPHFKFNKWLSSTSTEKVYEITGDIEVIHTATFQVRANITELAEDSLKARLAEATAERDAANQGLEAANMAVEAAQRELAGAEAGDGRDVSNRSLSERLRDAENAQVCRKSKSE